MSTPAFKRVLRRESHSPRTVAMIVAVVLMIVVLAYLGTEIVLYLLAQPALLLGPAAQAGFLIGLPTERPGWLVVLAGVVLAIVGFVFLFLALAPGKLPKHRMRFGERAVLVDNGVIASALAQHLSEETGLSRDDITVGVSHRTADVTLRPGLGIPLDEAPLKNIVQTELDSYELTPSIKSRVRVVRPKQNEDEQ
ncbi:alkaline shock response membrane anchor protein AmaP [Microbacterium kunmingense]|jgi:hypothetical protein|nr:alkaline shock response membrane anchor protein AmaP [Microbacterium kunmingense]PZT96948.1 MAG: DNA/RNA endonuclease G [Gordonia sp. (in: high G+C Gram-positive bacteria)]